MAMVHVEPAILKLRVADHGTIMERRLRSSRNHVAGPSAALLLIGKPPGLTVATSGATATTVATTAASQVTPAPFESVVGTETPAVTSVTARGTPTAAGFEFGSHTGRIVSMCSVGKAA
jgi:hypothetical protein